AGIDVDEEHFESVSSEDAAERRYQEWREDMPEVQSAYQPSGKLPVGGVVGLGLGTPVGAAGGGPLLLSPGGLFYARTLGIPPLIEWMAQTCGRVFCVLYLLVFLIALLGGGLAFAVHGWVAAMLTTGAGIAGKNRNVPAAVVASVFSCLLGLA